LDVLVGWNAFTYHEQDKDTGNWQVRLVLDGKDSPHRAEAEREALAENLRLLYVAVTRARHCCSVVWGPFKDAGTSALAYLLHPPRGRKGQDERTESLEAMKTRFEGLDPVAFRADLERLALASGGTIRIEALLDVPPRPVSPPYQPSPPLVCRPFAGQIERRERIASFSFLASGHGNTLPLRQETFLDEPDRDGMAWEGRGQSISTEGDCSGLFAFPRGTRAGTALHAILEQIEFQCPDRSSWEDTAAFQLQAHGFPTDWRYAVADMIEALVRLPLVLDGRSLTLDQVGPQDRIREMAFHLPLNLITPERLRRIFQGQLSPPLQAFPERLAGLGFQPTLGYLKGYIDLVFRFKGRYYLIDWKSNHLGNRPEDYAPGLWPVSWIPSCMSCSTISTPSPCTASSRPV
jgi:exodeoxyribonuclease V beta subunit